MVDATRIAHDLLTRARDGGGDPKVWNGIFEKLRETPAALARPAPRTWSLLHQAAWWGNADAVETLIREFHADPLELTNDKAGQDAASVATSTGHHDLARRLRPEETEVDTAHRLLDLAKHKGGEDATWKSIYEELLHVPGAAVRPPKRAYSLLHQAAFWGNREAALKLIDDFGMNPSDTTQDSHEFDAAGVAAKHKHEALAGILRERCGGTASAVLPGAVAVCPYLEDQAMETQHQGVRIWLCLREASAGAASLEWRLYDLDDQLSLSKAQENEQKSAKLRAGTVDFEKRQEQIMGERPRPVQFFSVKWEWDNGAGGKAEAEWVPYIPEAQLALEIALCKAECSAKAVASNGVTYVVDLVGFRQYSAEDDFKCRRIRRSGARLKDPYPRYVTEPHSGAQLDLGVPPRYWKKELYNGFTTQLFDLPLDTLIAQIIKYWMNVTIGLDHDPKYGQVPETRKHPVGMDVVRIEVVMQPRLWRRYLCYKAKLKNQAEEIRRHPGTKYLNTKGKEMKIPKIPQCDWLDQDVMESYFWHGCGKSEDGSLDSIDAIIDVGPIATEGNPTEMVVNDGASSRFSKPTSMFGAGVYLADLSSKANLYVPCPKCHKGAYFRDLCKCSPQDVEDAGPYRMLLMRAALGRVHIEHNHKDEAYKGAFNPAKKYHADSVMGEIGGALTNREYVVYNDSAVYPEFIVHYKRRAKAICCKIDEKCK